MKKITTSLILSLSIFIIIPQKTVAQLTPIVDSILMSDGRKLAADIYIQQVSRKVL